MTIYLGADHRGFTLKENIKKMLAGGSYVIVDCGNADYDQHDDFPDFARPVAEQVSKNPSDSRGIVICGSGFGVDIASNKFPGVRAALAMSPAHIEAGRHDDDVNVLAIAANFTSEADALVIVQKFLTTPFGGDEKYARRLKKIEG